MLFFVGAAGLYPLSLCRGGVPSECGIGRRIHAEAGADGEGNNRGAIPIDTEEKRVNWHKIRAEYISGVSQRKLAEKYGVSRTAIEHRSMKEKWSDERIIAKSKIQEKVIQKTAEKAADNATLAADIKRKGLLILSDLMDDFAKIRATEHRDYNGNNVTDIKRLRDLTAAYKDLTDDMPSEDDASALASVDDMLVVIRKTAQDANNGDNGICTPENKTP